MDGYSVMMIERPEDLLVGDVNVDALGQPWSIPLTEDMIQSISKNKGIFIWPIRVQRKVEPEAPIEPLEFTVHSPDVRPSLFACDGERWAHAWVKAEVIGKRVREVRTLSEEQIERALKSTMAVLGHYNPNSLQWQAFRAGAKWATGAKVETAPEVDDRLQRQANACADLEEGCSVTAGMIDDTQFDPKRFAFEHWHNKRYPEANKPSNLHYEPLEGGYSGYTTQMLWEAWQAASTEQTDPSPLVAKLRELLERKIAAESWSNTEYGRGAEAGRKQCAQEVLALLASYQEEVRTFVPRDTTLEPLGGHVLALIPEEAYRNGTCYYTVEKQEGGK